MIRPKYYDMEIDVIDFCQQNDIGFCAGNVIKYIVRYRKKGGIDDLEKARDYIDRMIAHEKELVDEEAHAVYATLKPSLLMKH